MNNGIGGLLYLTYDQKENLDYWRTRTESILGSGGPVASELRLWLNAMGFTVSSAGVLSRPSSTSSGIWTDIENWWVERVWLHLRNIIISTSDEWSGPSTLITSPRPDFSGINALLAIYPMGNHYFEVLNALYDRVTAVMRDNGYSDTDVEWTIAGLLVLFDVFLVSSMTGSYAIGGYIEYYFPEGTTGAHTFAWKTETIGPYTVSIYFCENGASWEADLDLPFPDYIICRQSVDCEVLLQDEEQKTLSADVFLGYRHSEDLDADVVLQESVESPLDADIAIRGDVQLLPVARMALVDNHPSNLAADEWLSAKHEFPLGASVALAYGRFPLDADICIQTPVQKALIANMYLEPDFESEELTRLERFHVQKFRIQADPRKYEVFNSETDEDVVP